MINYFWLLLAWMGLTSRSPNVTQVPVLASKDIEERAIKSQGLGTCSLMAKIRDAVHEEACLGKRSTALIIKRDYIVGTQSSEIRYNTIEFVESKIVRRCRESGMYVWIDTEWLCNSNYILAHIYW